MSETGQEDLDLDIGREEFEDDSIKTVDRIEEGHDYRKGLILHAANKIDLDSPDTRDYRNIAHTLDEYFDGDVMRSKVEYDENHDLLEEITENSEAIEELYRERT